MSMIGSGFWQKPNGEIIECGDFHENEAFKILFDIDKFEEELKSFISELPNEKQADLIFLIDFLKLKPSDTFIKSFIEDEVLPENIRDRFKKAIISASSEEVYDTIIGSNSGSKFINLYLSKGAVRYRIRGSELFINFIGDTTTDTVIEFLGKVNLNPSTLVIEDAATGEGVRVDAKNLFNVKKLKDFFSGVGPDPRGGLISQIRKLFKSKNDKLLKLASIYEKCCRDE